LSWFASLYTPGRFTSGFDIWIESCEFSRENRKLRAKLKPVNAPGRDFGVLVCMNPDSRYRVLWNGKPAVFTNPHDGFLQIQLPAGPGELKIENV
jgi:hypothetical protein